MNKKAFYFTAAVITYFIGRNIILGSSQYTMNELVKRFQFDSKEFRTPPNAIQLRSVRIFPGEKDEEGGIYIGHAQSMSVDSNGLIYIPDFRNDEVLVFSEDGHLVRRFGQSGEGPGDLRFPSSIFCGADCVLVREIRNRRFQFFSLTGKYLNGFRCFKDYDQFLIIDKSIFGAPLQTYPDVKNSDSALIDCMDIKGRVQMSFGAILKIPTKDFQSDHNLKLAVTNKNQIVVSFCHFPIIRLYSITGKLIREFHPTSGIIEKIVPLNQEMLELSKTEGRTPRGFTTNALFVDSDGIYIAIATPKRLEILLYNENGEVKEYYYKNIEEKMGLCPGLFVKKSQSGKHFYILRTLPQSCIEEFILK